MSTKILLVEDVEDLGRSGEIVSVKPGYARNFLLPRGFGMVADKRALRLQARLQEARLVKAAEEKQEAEALAEKMNGVSISTIVKVDHEGRMYGSVTVIDVVDLLNEQANIQLDKKAVLLKQPIKQVGDHTIQIKLKEGVTSSIELKISPEEVNGTVPAKGKE